jgi:hypothetical protein
MKKTLLLAACAVAICGPASAANLLVNGDFEASTSETVTPPGWTNIGHSDGVIPYTLFLTPAYDGNYFYDVGGFGDPAGPVGDGIEQTVTTTPGTSYRLTFGLTSESGPGAGPSQLEVLIGSVSTFYDLVSGDIPLGVAFTTHTIDYIAAGASTTIQFIETANASGGNNDPMIDGVIFEVPGSGGGGGVPEPGAWTLMIAGFGLAGAALRGRSASAA